MRFETSLATAVLAALSWSLAPAGAAPMLVNSLTLPATTVDLFPGVGANQNRFGFFSDIYYHAATGAFYAIPDRGPGGGLLSYDTRIEQFKVDINPVTGAISNFQVTKTIAFTDGKGNAFNGLNPGLLNGNVSTLGLSFDPEGLVVGPTGTFFVADEYGPSLYEFDAGGKFIRSFENPANVIPKNGTTEDYVNGRPVITSGRQDNRGYEGLAMSPDGKKLFGILQDPLVNEGDPDGRRSGNVRIVEFDVKTGKSTGQYIYQLESVDDINDRIPGTGDDFGPNAQGRNIGVSAIVALGDGKFLVLERDNRGVGVEDPDGSNPVGTKRIYTIDLAGATDVSGLDLAGQNALPPGVTPVSKSLYFDYQAALGAAGLAIPEKFEGLAVGPKLAGGGYMLISGTDNDFSVTQTGAGEQFDVCSDGSTVTIDSGCPAGSSLLPGYLYSIADPTLSYVAPAAVPEPSTTSLWAIGVVLLIAGWRRRNRL